MDTIESPKVTIADLIPQASEFKLDDGTVINLRPVDVDDWSWMQHKFGHDVEKELKAMVLDNLLIIIYRLMDDEMKRRFKPKMTSVFDDEGDEKEVRITGPQMLGKQIKGMGGLQNALAAFQTSLGVGDEVAEILATDDGTGPQPIEKKTVNRATRRKATKRTGRKSTTSSPQSTATHSESSAS